MTIELAKDVEDFLQAQVRAGVCANAAELANEVLRSIREQQRRPFTITPELEAWLLEAADKPASPLTSADFDGRALHGHRDLPRRLLELSVTD